MGWLGFGAAFVAFAVSHSFPTRPAVKARLVRRLGARGFTVAYALLSLAMLALLIFAAGRAPYVAVWYQHPWQVHVVHIGMLIVCLIAALALLRPNPFSFGGAHDERFDPARPGIVRWARHPVLLALGLWAGLHLLVNGDLAHLLLFAPLFAFALAGMRLIDARKRREMGAERWQALRDAVRAGPILPRPASWPGAILRVVIGVAAFAALILLHPLVIGVPAM
ncbi:NnrU family protein [Roseovarius spongiae]|uniref:NnrU family protein n=1 Tax=Roseovarius spongiae TaxID=2320272 RepID=A0A3A8B610_9RHOB|nr:NnrU family protein [Roseovarius spongiae]RKF16165.1 NnrU family protein [Roseovarius spongiae]